MGIISKISKDKKTDNYSQSPDQATEQELTKVVNDLPTTSENGNVIKNYLAETRWLAHTLKSQPEMTQEILRVLSITRDSSLLLGFTPVYKLYKATEDLYKAIIDGKAVFSDNLYFLINETADKISEMCNMIEQGRMEELFAVNVKPYLLFLDKAVAGELFNAMSLAAGSQEQTLLLQQQMEDEDRAAEIKRKEKEKVPEKITLDSSKISDLVNQHQEMIARSYIIINQIETLKEAIFEDNKKLIRDTSKQLSADAQNLQANLLLSHDQLLSFVHEDSFLAKHQDFHGFFVFANNRKYMIPSEFVIDVISESPLNYVEKQNQKFVVYIQENEMGNEKNREEIPVYSLSSLLPGTPVSEAPVMDTILLVNFQAQKVGIIVDEMQKFVTVIKMPMPRCFKYFPILKGLAFDEKYDMIPILYMPMIIKKFRSMRGYDVKKFEASTRKHINHALVVDDSETTRLIEHTILKGYGFYVEEAFDGIDAMDKIKLNQFDLIICDDKMPRMNGEIFLDNIRRLENYKKVPVIALSNSPIPKADIYISKSDFKRDNLIQKIKELLNE